jgi:putative chitinase
MVKLKSLQQTWLKARPEQSSALKPEELIKFPSGGELAILDANIFEDKGGHFKVLFTPPITITLKGVEAKWSEGYIYGSHWSGISATFAAKAAAGNKYSPAGSSIILQPAPLFIQSDNKDWNDDGSASSLRYGGVQCGLTSASMLLASIWPNAKVKQLAAEAEDNQFENWVAGQFKRLGQPSTSMEGHVAVLKALGIKSTARRDATIADLKQALHKHPVISGLSYSSAGHFVCAVGVSDKAGDLPEKWPVGAVDTLVSYPQDIPGPGVIINDPYGQRDYSGSGNNWIDIARKKNDTFGLHNLLSNSELERFWTDGGEESGWAVFVDPSTPNAGNQPANPVVLGRATTAPPAATGSYCVDRATLRKCIAAVAADCVSAAEIDGITDALIANGAKFNVGTKLQVCHFLGQVAHESGAFMYTEEIGDYDYFESNYGIAVRDDLGNEVEGDGAKYSGKGLIMTTGLGNYKKLAAKMNNPAIVSNPELLAKYPLALIAGLSWWQDNKMVEADRGVSEADILAVTKVVNGGTNGIDDRIDKTLAVAKILGL